VVEAKQPHETGEEALCVGEPIGGEKNRGTETETAATELP